MVIARDNMNKYEKLLKKVDTFYKQAVYGNRSSFLQAIAQDGSRLNEQIRERINSLMQDVAAIKPNSSQPLQSKLMDFVNFNTANRTFTKEELNELYQAVQEARALITGPEHAPQAERASELAQMVQQLMGNQTDNLVGGYSPLDYGSSPKSDPSKFPAPAPAKPAGPAAFPKDVQNKLNEMLQDLATQGDVFYVPFKASGVLDAGTQKGLDAWRKYMNMPKASLKDLIENINSYYTYIWKPNSKA